jgi:hypothetical protein
MSTPAIPTKVIPYPYEYRTQLAKQWLGKRYLLASEGKPIPCLLRRQAG